MLAGVPEEWSIKEREGTDYDELAQWGVSMGWDTQWRAGPERGDAWTCDAVLSAAGDVLVVAADTSADALQRVWGMVVVVGDYEGKVLWQDVAWMQAVSTPRTLFEMTALHEGSTAVYRRAVAEGTRVGIIRWMDNQPGVI